MDFEDSEKIGLEGGPTATNLFEEDDVDIFNDFQFDGDDDDSNEWDLDDDVENIEGKKTSSSLKCEMSKLDIKNGGDSLDEDEVGAGYYEDDVIESPENESNLKGKGQEISKDDKLDTSEVPHNFTFFLTPTEWGNVIKQIPDTKGDRKTHFEFVKGFHHVLAEKFEKVNPFCVLYSNQKFINAPYPTRGSFIRCYMYCSRGTECRAKWTFSVPKKPAANKDVKVYVSLKSGKLVHFKSLPGSRKWTGKLSEKAAQNMKDKFPAAERLRVVANADENMINAGNFSEIKTLKTFQRIKEKETAKKDLASNAIDDLCLTAKAVEEKFPDKYLKGYVQHFSVIPFRIVSHSFFQMKVLRLAAKSSEGVSLLIDATGSLVKNMTSPMVKDTKPLIFTVVFQDPKTKLLLPVTEMISTDLTYFCIYQWLEGFFESFKKRLRVQEDFYGIKKVHIDFSKPLLASVVSVFSRTTVDVYLNMIWEKMTNADSNEKVFPIHICRFHIMNMFERRFATYFKNKPEVHNLATSWANSFVRSRDMHSIQRRMQDCAVIFGYECAVNVVTSRIENISKPTNRSGARMWEKPITISGSGQEMWKKSKFGLLAHNIFQLATQANNDVVRKQKSKGKVSRKENECYCPAFLNYLKVHVFPYSPIITHAILNVCHLSPATDTINPIENHHGFLKLNIYPKKKWIKPSRFVRTQAEIVLGRCKEIFGAYHPLAKQQEEAISATPNIEEEIQKTVVSSEDEFEEPDWGATPTEPPILGSQTCVNTKARTREVSPRSEKEGFKSNKRQKKITSQQAFMEKVVFIKWGGTMENGSRFFNTCALDSILTVLCALYQTHSPFFDFFLNKSDPSYENVETAISFVLEKEFDYAKQFWVSEIAGGSRPEPGDLLGTIESMGLNLLNTWINIRRFEVCLNERCSSFEVLGSDGLLAPDSKLWVDDTMQYIDERTPDDTIRLLSTLCETNLHCNNCRGKLFRRCKLKDPPPFLFYRVWSDEKHEFPEPRLQLHQTIDNVRYKVFAYILLRGGLKMSREKRLSLGYGEAHFVVKFIVDNKRILYDGLSSKPRIDNDVREDDGVTTVWLIPE